MRQMRCHLQKSWRVEFTYKEHAQIFCVPGDRQLLKQADVNFTKDKILFQICCKNFKFHSLLTHWKNVHLEEHGSLTAYKEARKYFTRSGPFTCDVCNKVFQTRTKISSHLNAHFKYKRLHGFLKHSSKRRPRFPKAERFCDICGKVFLEKDKIRQHIRKHLETLTSRYRRFIEGIPEKISGGLRLVNCSCDLCGEKLFVRRKLRIHIASHACRLRIQNEKLMKAK